MLNTGTMNARLAANPIERTMDQQTGKKVTDFRIANEADYKLKSGKNKGQRPVMFFNCEAFGSTADNIAKMAVKGSLVSLEYTLKPQKPYTNKKGQVVISDVLQIKPRGFNMLESKATTDQRRKNLANGNSNSNNGSQSNNGGQTTNNDPFGGNNAGNGKSGNNNPDPFASNKKNGKDNGDMPNPF